MRSEPGRRGRAPSPLLCYLWLAAASGVTLATSSGLSGAEAAGHYRVVSDCAGAKREGTINANFRRRSIFSPRDGFPTPSPTPLVRELTPTPTATVIPPTPAASATPDPAATATPEATATATATPTPTPTPTPSPTPPSSFSPAPTATPPDAFPESGTAPGAKAFGFPSDRFYDDGDSNAGEWTLVSRGGGRECKAAMRNSENPSEIAFACRDQKTQELQCVITLTLLSESFVTTASGAEDATLADEAGIGGSSVRGPDAEVGLGDSAEDRGAEDATPADDEAPRDEREEEAPSDVGGGAGESP